MGAFGRSNMPILLGFLLLLMFGCSGEKSDKGSDVRSDKGLKKEPSEGQNRTKAAFSLTANELSQEFKRNKQAALAKYRGKVIGVTGIVKGIGRSSSGEGYLSLEEDEKNPLSVMCYTEDPLPWRKAVPGQTVKLQGMWPQSSATPRLVHSTILEVTGSGPPSLAAKELGNAYAAGADEANKKYSDRYLIVIGEVADIKFDEAGAASATLKTGGRTKVVCHFSAFEKNETTTLKPGQKVRVIGRSDWDAPSDEVGLYFCTPLAVEK